MKKRVLASLFCTLIFVADASAGRAVVIKDPHRHPAVQKFQSAPVQPGAGYSPVQLSLVTPMQFPPEDWDVGGFALNLLYGTSCNFRGLAIGGIANRMTGRTDGLLIAPIVNVVDSDSNSFQLSLVNFSRLTFTGMQVGAVNVAAFDESTGSDAFQVGALYNYADSIHGAQLSLINQADYVKGVQLGLMNFAGDMMGVQIGLINVISSKDLPFMPIFNARF